MRQRSKMKTVKSKMSNHLPPSVLPELERPDDLDADLTADMDEEEKAAWEEWKNNFADPYIAQYTAAIRKFLEEKRRKRKTAAKPQRKRQPRR